MTTKQYDASIFDGVLNFPFTGPANAQSWDEAAGEDGDCLKVAMQQHTPRGFYGKCRDAVIDALATAGHKPRVTGTKAGKKEGETVDVLETDNVFVQRLLAAGPDNGGISKDDFIALGLAAVAGVNYLDTIKGGVREGRLSNAVLEKADTYIRWWNAGKKDDGTPTSVEKSLGIMRAWLPTASLTDPNDREEVARLLVAVENARKAEAMA